MPGYADQYTSTRATGGNAPANVAYLVDGTTGAVGELSAEVNIRAITATTGVGFGGAATSGYLVHVNQPVATSGSPSAFVVTGAAHTTLAASTEAIDVLFDIGRTVQFATGALTTQRAVDVEAPTYAFAGASTLTNAVTFDIDSAPAAGTNATFTTTSALRVGAANVSIGPTAAGMTYATIRVPSHTVTVTGGTQVTSTGFAGVSIGTLTITDTSAVTVDSAAALYIGAAPVQAGSVTLTNAYSLWCDSGIARFDGATSICTLAVIGTVDYQSGYRVLDGSLSDIGGLGRINVIASSDISLSARSANTGLILNVGENAGTTTTLVLRSSGVVIGGTSGAAGRGLTINPTASTSGSPSMLLVTGPAHTTLAAGAEAPDLDINLARTVQFATGAITSQRAVRIQAPTLAFVGASTVTNAATLYVDAAPVAGTNATLTNTYAFWIDAGGMRTDGAIFAELGSATAASYSFLSSGTTDPDTGMFSPAANIVAFTAGGAEIARMQASSSGGGWIVMDEADSNPGTAVLDSLDSCAIYMTNNKFVVAYNYSGTIGYLNIALDTATTSWTNSTTAP